ncbi:unnamed protein product [Cylindrotheca closterium]|uniref:Uncharacterized protein n=1 Tax=Cylindrotheca closterium TaxID=2856 RepID=A0AAD2FST8_9STRA|nr:unnamed protein product [Cylindrotheca closterium]
MKTRRRATGPIFTFCLLFLISFFPILRERSQLRGILQQIIADSSSLTELVFRTSSTDETDNNKHFMLPEHELVFRFDKTSSVYDSADDEDGDESPVDMVSYNEANDEEGEEPNNTGKSSVTLPNHIEKTARNQYDQETIERIKAAVFNDASVSSVNAPTEVEKTATNNDFIHEQEEATEPDDTNATLRENRSRWSRQMWQSISKDSVSSTVQVDEMHNGEMIDGQLVVNVDQTYMFWNDGQKKLCELLQNMTLADNWDVPEFVNETTRDPLERPLLNVTMNCTAETKKEGFGQGNWVTAYYMARLAAAKARVDFQFQCSDGTNSKMKLLLPWFGGRFDAPNVSHAWPYSGSIPTQEEACTTKYPRIRIDKLADQITDTVRKMAVTLVGSTTRDDETRVHPQVPQEQAPLIPNVELDDAVIHFRCGDVMGGARRGDFGMIKFTEYERWISPDAKSIGILTQPFDPSRNRRLDIGRIHYCRNATYTLVEILQKTYPNTKITVHNGPNETLPLAFARLVSANQSFTTLSSFGIFPVIGTYGQGYFQRGNRGVNPFANYLPSIMPNLHMMTAEVLTTGDMWRMNLTSILTWMTSPTTDVKQQ